jgi:cytochrome c oxidase cbb3-type subunit IV
MREIFRTFFTMDLQIMTANDWFGTITTGLSFTLMVCAYYWIFHPKNKQNIERHRHHLLRHDKDELL